MKQIQQTTTALSAIGLLSLFTISSIACNSHPNVQAGQHANVTALDTGEPRAKASSIASTSDATTLTETLDIWIEGQKELALDRFLAIDHTDNDRHAWIVPINEDEFSAKAAASNDANVELSQRLIDLTTAYRRLATYAVERATKLRESGNTDQAERIFDALHKSAQINASHGTRVANLVGEAVAEYVERER